MEIRAGPGLLKVAPGDRIRTWYRARLIDGAIVVRAVGR
jgi:hypothetical protein